MANSAPGGSSHHSLRSGFAFAARSGGKDASRSKKLSSFPTWLLLTGILLIPSTLAVHLSGEGFKFTPGRAAITLLLLPALAKLVRERRRFVISDLFVFLTSAWMIGSRIQDDGINDSAVAEVIELLGGYIVARAYFFGRPALQDFIRVFKILMVIVIFLASLEPLAGTDVVLTITSTLFGTPLIGTQTRYGIARAMSTIEDAELYGTVCCVAGALCLYMTTSGVRRLLWVGFCFFGCLLSISSGPIMAFAVMVATYVYDRMFKQFAWRWRAYGMIVLGFVAAVYLISNNPTDWLVSHLTLDPATGYFRIAVFDYSYDQIAVHPYKGWGFGLIGDDDFFSQVSVDSVWLVTALRFGLPMMYLFLLTNIGTFLRIPPKKKSQKTDPYIDNAGTAFTFSIMCFMGIGLTVHFWNATWMLWAVCLGARASIKEAELVHYGAQRKLGNTRPSGQQRLAGA
jgi:hypothetical protein